MKTKHVVLIIAAVLILGSTGLMVLAAAVAPVTTAEQAQPAEDPAQEPGATEVDAGAPEYTGAQEAAISKAEDYLAFQSFSKQGLRKQLEYEGFTTKDSKLAVNVIDVDWTAQAKAKAEEYIDFDEGYSCEGLINQLEWEKFTPKQARAGAAPTKPCN